MLSFLGHTVLLSGDIPPTLLSYKNKNALYPHRNTERRLLSEINRYDGHNQSCNKEHHCKPQSPSFEDSLLGATLILAELGIICRAGNGGCHVLVGLLILHQTKNDQQYTSDKQHSAANDLDNAHFCDTFLSFRWDIESNILLVNYSILYLKLQGVLEKKLDLRSFFLGLDEDSVKKQGAPL